MVSPRKMKGLSSGEITGIVRDQAKIAEAMRVRCNIDTPTAQTPAHCCLT